MKKIYCEEKHDGRWHSYESRQEIMLKFVNDMDKSLIDLGAGQMYIKKKLPKSIEYYPVDYFQRFPETIVCNFNNGEFPEVKADVVFESGVIEHINTITCHLTANGT